VTNAVYLTSCQVEANYSGSSRKGTTVSDQLENHRPISMDYYLAKLLATPLPTERMESPSTGGVRLTVLPAGVELMGARD